jgi:hypothetical protein
VSNLELLEKLAASADVDSLEKMLLHFFGDEVEGFVAALDLVEALKREEKT